MWFLGRCEKVAILTKKTSIYVCLFLVLVFKLPTWLLLRCKIMGFLKFWLWVIILSTKDFQRSQLVKDYHGRVYSPCIIHESCPPSVKGSRHSGVSGRETETQRLAQFKANIYAKDKQLIPTNKQYHAHFN